MNAITLTRTHGLVRAGAKCRQCERTFKAGEQVLTHRFGRDAPWDLRHFSIHAACAAKVAARLPTLPADTVLGTALAAAQFRRIIERVRAGGPVLERNAP